MIIDNIMEEAHERSFREIACQIWEQLERHYPHYMWIVSYQGGALIVRNSVINAAAASALKAEGFGFVIPKDKIGTYQDIVKSAIEAGGSMLELFGLKRAGWDGSDPVPPKDWRPKQQAGFA